MSVKARYKAAVLGLLVSMATATYGAPSIEVHINYFKEHGSRPYQSPLERVRDFEVDAFRRAAAERLIRVLRGSHPALSGAGTARSDWQIQLDVDENGRQQVMLSLSATSDESVTDPLTLEWIRRGGAFQPTPAMSVDDLLRHLERAVARELVRRHRRSLVEFFQVGGDKFALELAYDGEPEDTAFRSTERLVVRIMAPNRPREFVASRMPGAGPPSFELRDAVLPPPGRGFEARASLRVTDGFNRTGYFSVQFRRKEDTGLSGSFARFLCPASGEGACCLDDEAERGWVNAPHCGPGASAGRSMLEILVPAARARPVNPGAGWSVPSLKTLLSQARSGKRYAGFTVFNVRSSDTAGLDADAFTYAVRVNGEPAYFDGLPPDSTQRPFSPEDGLSLSFGLQNLNFSGRRKGCDTIEVDLEFYRDGEKTGEVARLVRPYVALRDTSELGFPLTADSRRFEWDGVFRTPELEREYQILLTSRIVDVPRAASREILDNLSAPKVRALHEGKDVIDRDLNLRTGNGQKMVAIIRPPLTQKVLDDGRIRLAYGLTLGIIQPSGQVKFTFGKAEANAVSKAWIRAVNSDRSLRRRFGAEPWVRPQRQGGLLTPPGICDRMDDVLPELARR